MLYDHRAPITCIDCHEHTNIIVSCDSNGTILVHELLGGKLLSDIHLKQDVVVGHMSLLSDCTLFLYIELFDVVEDGVTSHVEQVCSYALSQLYLTGEMLRTTDIGEALCGYAVSLNEEYFVGATVNGSRIRIWTVSWLDCLYEIRIGIHITSLCFVTQKYLTVGCVDGIIICICIQHGCQGKARSLKSLADV